MHAFARVLALCAALSITAGCDADEGEGTDENAGTDEATDTDDGMLTEQEFQAVCEQQGSRESCEAVPEQSNDENAEYLWCAWVVEVPAQLDGDTCTFGTPISGCRVAHASEIGCASGSLDACSSAELGWSRMDGDTLLVGRGGLCDFPTTTSCNVSPMGVVGAPECACLCDSGFPL
jgi:hypothetical protein